MLELLIDWFTYVFTSAGPGHVGQAGKPSRPSWPLPTAASPNTDAEMHDGSRPPATDQNVGIVSHLCNNLHFLKLVCFF